MMNSLRIFLFLLIMFFLFVGCNDFQEDGITNKVSESIIEKSNKDKESKENALEVLGRYQTNIFNAGASEIVAFSAKKKRVFTVNGASKTIDVLDVSDLKNPTLLLAIDMTPYGNSANSVAIGGSMIAAAIEKKKLDGSQDKGVVAFFDLDGNFINSFIVGHLPDMLLFTHDNKKVLVANEGESIKGVDPKGSISIIELSAAADLSGSIITDLDFSAYDSKVETLRSIGVRIFPGKLPSVDLEPEYITIDKDDVLAYVTLQENNAIAVIDINNKSIKTIQPLGTKDHSKGRPVLDEYTFKKLPKLNDSNYNLGGFSGLWYAGKEENNLVFYAVPDRGPNADSITDANGTKQPFIYPNYQSQIVKFTLNETNGHLKLKESDIIKIFRQDGVTPISGLSNIVGADHIPVDASLNPLPYDSYGADFEGIAIDADDQSFWLCDEYRPSIYHVNSAGVLLARFVPTGTGTLGGQSTGFYGQETLPAIYSKRAKNRGFEAIAIDQDANIVYAFIQSPLQNPSATIGNSSTVIRILGIRTSDGAPVCEYVYLLEKPIHSKSLVDKIGDAFYKGNGKFLVVERDSSLDDKTGKKYIFEIDIKGATNILGSIISTASTGATLESMTADQLKANSIIPVYKEKVLNIPSLGYLASDKVEGLTMLDDGRIAILNDNDFGIRNNFEYDAKKVPCTLGIISFDDSNKLDSNDTDKLIGLKNLPLRGMYMPDGISSYSYKHETYLVIANEGDGRDNTTDSEDEVKVSKLKLNPTIFTDPSQFLNLRVSSKDGDLDKDGFFDRLFSYGARSFSIIDSYGNLVFDSGDDIEEKIAELLPANFNAGHDNNNLDDRSDNKGPEPEGIAIGEIDGETYAFIGLERIGGVMVYNISNPYKPIYKTYLNPRDFTIDPKLGTPTVNSGDLGPEGITFVPSKMSPNGKDLLVVANEISGTTTVIQINKHKLK